MDMYEYVSGQRIFFKACLPLKVYMHVVVELRRSYTKVSTRGMFQGVDSIIVHVQLTFLGWSSYLEGQLNTGLTTDAGLSTRLGLSMGARVRSGKMTFFVLS